jgi:hypothetical protein
LNLFLKLQGLLLWKNLLLTKLCIYL